MTTPMAVPIHEEALVGLGGSSCWRHALAADACRGHRRRVAGRATWRSRTDARHLRTASATSSGVSATSTREPVVSVTTVSGFASIERMRSGFR